MPLTCANRPGARLDKPHTARLLRSPTMHDPTYPSAPPPISRELDRIATGLTAGGAILTGTSVSAPDEMGDIAWQAPEDGTAWMCVVSRLDATLWSEWAEGGKDAPAANDAEMAA